MSDAEHEEGGGEAVVLDFLPHGRTEDDRPQYEKEPLAYALDVETFRLYELIVDDDGVSIGDRVDIYDSEAFERVTEVDFEDIPGGAQSELGYAVEDLVEAEEDRFVDFYNDAQPITLRLHQLNLLPGIWTSASDSPSRASGTSNPGWTDSTTPMRYSSSASWRNCARRT
jgi:putative nucleotide binding protein